MKNTFEEFTSKYHFKIPEYQRDYSWQESHIEQFIKDIKDSIDKQYYLGHFILENDKMVIDGQQRLTTVYLFLTVCNYLIGNDNEIFDLELSKYNNDLFKDLLKHDSLEKIAKTDNKDKVLDEENINETLSLKRIKIAICLLFKNFSSCDKSDLEDYINVVNNAKCSHVSYDDKIISTLIFELHNNRGAKLTETEKAKALFMRQIYLYSDNKDQDIVAIQNNFASIIKLEEETSSVSFRGELELDDIFKVHLQVVDDGAKENEFNSPKNSIGDRGIINYLTNKIDSYEDDKEKINYVKSVANEFSKSMEILAKLRDRDEENPLVGDVLIMDKNKSLRLFLNYFRNGKEIETSLLGKWEQFLLLWDWHGSFWNSKAQEKDRFYKIYIEARKTCKDVENLLIDYFKGKEPFYGNIKFSHHRHGREGNNLIETVIAYEKTSNLKNDAYSNRHEKIRYLLYKFEIYKDINARGKLRKMFKEDKLTLDHIVARNLQIENPDSDKDSYSFENINGIGNLVLLDNSSNASAGDKEPKEHYKVYEKKGLTSYSYKFANEFDINNVEKWDAKIEERSVEINDFFEEYFFNKTIWE